MYYNSSSNQAKVCINGGWAALGVPTVTTLPSSPSDGDEVYYKVSNLGNGNSGYWHLRYNASTTYWDFLGGPGLRGVDTSTRNASSSTFVSTGAPTITAPLTMQFDASFGDQFSFSGAGADGTIGLFVNGSAVDDVRFNVPAGGGSTIGKTSLNNTVNSGQVVGLEYKADAGAVTFYPMYLEITPIRVK